MKRLLASFAAFALVLGLTAPVAAQTTDRTAKREEARARAQEKRESRETKIAEIKDEVAARKLALQQEKCERFEARLEAALPRLSNSAIKVKGNVDKVYERVQGFYEKGQLTVSNYDEQVEAIEVAKANAETALDALQDFNLEVDCTDQKVGTQLDGYRTAVKAARTEIKTYHKAVVGLVSSMRAAAAEENAKNKKSGDTTEGDTETTTGTDTTTEQPTEGTNNAQ